MNKSHKLWFQTSVSLILLLFVCISASAQKIGHFNAKYVVSKMPEYAEAQQKVDELANLWYEESQNMYLEIGKMQYALQAESVLLTEEMKAERQAEIDKKLEAAKAYHHKVFGPNGLLFLKKQELVKPELDRVTEAVRRVCEAHRLDYLIDKSNDHMVFMYTNPVHDYTDFVLDELGLGNKNDVIR